MINKSIFFYAISRRRETGRDRGEDGREGTGRAPAGPPCPAPGSAATETAHADTSREMCRVARSACLVRNSYCAAKFEMERATASAHGRSHSGPRGPLIGVASDHCATELHTVWPMQSMADAINGRCNQWPMQSTADASTARQTDLHEEGDARAEDERRADRHVKRRRLRGWRSHAISTPPPPPPRG